MSEDCAVKSHVQLLANVRTICRFLCFVSSEKHEVKRLYVSQYVCMFLVENFFRFNFDECLYWKPTKLVILTSTVLHLTSN